MQRWPNAAGLSPRAVRPLDAVTHGVKSGFAGRRSKGHPGTSNLGGPGTGYALWIQEMKANHGGHRGQEDTSADYAGLQLKASE